MSNYAHQQKILDEDPKKTGLFLGTGSGKTRIALKLARHKVLIIAPKTQVEDENWERELDEIWKSKIQQVGQVSTITVVSKEVFRRDWEDIPKFDTVIVDEAHTCLGVTPNTRQRRRVIIPRASQLYEALEGYLAKHKPERLYLVTATVMRSPMAVWAAAQLLGKKLDYFKFRAAFYTRLPMPGREVWAPKRDSKEKDALAKLVRSIGYVGRLEDFFDVPELPPKVEYIPLTAKQIARIKDMPQEYPEPIVRVGKRHQIENGVLAGDEFSAPEEFENGKIERILELASEFPRMVIFARYKAQIAAIQKALTKEGYCTWTLTGDTKDRGGVIRQANELDGVFIAQAQISAGWELPRTPVMIFASMSYSFVDRIQAEGRIQRVNNIKKNLYIDLVAKGETVDKAVLSAIRDKKDFDERIYLGI